MLTIVIVFYGIDLSDSITLNSLLMLIKEMSIDLKINIILYDNNKRSSRMDRHSLTATADINLVYKHNPNNPGIAEAYNYAFEKAKAAGSEWLMLLDQDTDLTEKYLLEVLTEIKKNNLGEVALVPQIKEPNRDSLISPVVEDSSQLLMAGSHKNIMAINSGMVVKLTFLEEIGGFNLSYPLDYLDHWFFHMIQEKNQSVRVLKSNLTHDLSVKNLKTVNNQRYENILFYEKKFLTEFKPEKLGKYYLHSVLRLGKCLLISPSKVRIILKTLFRNVS